MSKDGAPAIGNISRDTLKRFRREMHGLAGIWIFFALLCLVLGSVMLSGEALMFPGVDQAGFMLIGAIVLLQGVGWGVSGFATAYKQMWGVYTGLTVSYLNLAGNLVQINVCGLVVTIAIIIQAHRVLKLSRELTRNGIPLTHKPR